ncbi:MAG: hypothetical protein H0T89_05490 [Deltaproteobacteria bacterium]|nr:hypothetical protein [Deltaproteobacteria bacterium]MDQ3298180.1 hypothetical protein [Myxococcota bacterium]
MLAIRISSVLLVTACSSATATNDSPDAGTPTYQRYTGRLASTATFPFGGPPYCNFSVTLKDVELDVMFRDESFVVATTLKNRMVEANVGSCPYPPGMPSNQVFEHRGGPWGANDDGNHRPILAGLDANKPETAVTAEVGGPNAPGQRANLRWARLGAEPTLTWIVTASVTLQLATCTAGAAICVGGTEGSLYTCVDGAVMHQVMQCEAGCAASGQACN